MGDLEHAEMESFCGGSKLCSHQRQWSCGGHLGMLSAQQESAPLGGGHDLTNSIPTRHAYGSLLCEPATYHTVG